LRAGTRRQGKPRTGARLPLPTHSAWAVHTEGLKSISDSIISTFLRRGKATDIFAIGERTVDAQLSRVTDLPDAVRGGALVDAAVLDLHAADVHVAHHVAVHRHELTNQKSATEK